MGKDTSCFGKVGMATCFDGKVKGIAHRLDIACCGNGSVTHDGTGTHLHGLASIRWFTNSGINNDRECSRFKDDLDKVLGR